MINQASLYAIMNTISTGNTILDIVICLIIPSIISNAFDKMSTINLDVIYWVLDRLCNKYYERHLVYESKSYWDNNVNFSRNNILQKAIELYISENFESKNFKNTNINFRAIREKFHYDNESGITSYDRTVDQVRSYKVTHLPTKNRWISLNEKIDIKETFEEKNNTKGEISKQVIGIHLRSKKPEECDKFIIQVIDWYCQKLKEYNDNTRNYYIPYTKTALDTDLLYYCQKLSDFKQFDSIFFPNKTNFIARIDDFINKKGIYSVPGYAYKLGILLHGPPGTGKTSLIKALAHYTDRHIVNVSLSIIKNKTNLRRIFYELKFPLENEDIVKKIDYNNIIFILEDIDCMTDIVINREKEPTDSGIIKNLLKDDLTIVDNKITSIKSEINLSDLLEILDGIVDSPGRIIIMTTNHKDKLDKALIRPGRMDIDLLMNYIKYPEALELINHFNLKNKKINKQKLAKYINNNPKTTPAKLIEIYHEYLY